MTDNTGTDVWTDVPAETPPENDVPADLDEQSDDDTGLDSGFGLGIDVANAPELEDSELGSVLEALLLVVDTPVTVDQLAAATEQPAYRVGAKLALMAEELKARDSGIDLREAGGRLADVHEGPVRALCGAPAARRSALQADACGARDVGRGGLSPARYAGTCQRRARRQRRRGHPNSAGTRAGHRGGRRPRLRCGDLRDHRTVPREARLDVAGGPSGHRAAASGRRCDRRSERNTQRRATFHETQRRARPQKPR